VERSNESLVVVLSGREGSGRPLRHVLHALRGLFIWQALEQAHWAALLATLWPWPASRVPLGHLFALAGVPVCCTLPARVEGGGGGLLFHVRLTAGLLLPAADPSTPAYKMQSGQLVQRLLPGFVLDRCCSHRRPIHSRGSEATACCITLIEHEAGRVDLFRPVAAGERHYEGTIEEPSGVAQMKLERVYIYTA